MPMSTTAPLSQLQVFLAVARLSSFSAAARELRVSTSAVSQAVRQLEEQLRVALLVRTTRSVSLTDEGRRLVEGAGPALGQAIDSLEQVSAQPGELVGRLRLSVPRIAVPFVITPMLATFRRRHPRLQLEIIVDDRFVDIIAEGYDAGVRLTEAIERDMVQVRLSDAFRFVVVAAPSYLGRHGTPQRPEDLLEHECITYRSLTTGGLYAWELERGRKSWRVPVRGAFVTNDIHLTLEVAEQGLALAYLPEPEVAEQLRAGRLRCLLDAYAPIVPGFFIYYPRRSQRSPRLRAFVDAAKELVPRTLPGRKRL
jgi:DNA-binding transcriptional LysR family regulator